jgi:hypothetical protein
VAQYGLEDGRIINLNDRTTPIVGAEFSLLKELFRPTPSTAPRQGVLKDRL